MINFQSEMKEWKCPVGNCETVIKRKQIRGTDEGAFPDDYDYTLWESDFDFLMRVIEHLAYDIGFKVIPAP